MSWSIEFLNWVPAESGRLSSTEVGLSGKMTLRKKGKERRVSGQEKKIYEREKAHLRASLLDEFMAYMRSLKRRSLFLSMKASTLYTT